MDRTEIAVAGSGSVGPRVRLCVTPGPSRDRFELTLLHNDRQTGTFARVAAAQVRTRRGWEAAAVKLQRDQALNRDEHTVVSAKFDREWAIHARLQAGRATPPQVIRLLDTRGSDSAGADVLPPCILCRHAAHGLALRCPGCGGELASPRPDQQELLRCPRCNESYQTSQYRTVLRHSVRRDPACEGCSHQHDGSEESCLRSAGVLNFFPSRLLILERLDLDLADYLAWSAGEPCGTLRTATVARFQQHRDRLTRHDDALPPEVGPIVRLGRAVRLIESLAAGVAALHERHVAHLDLKPANVCVRFRGSSLDVRLIDLGLAVGAGLPNTLRDIDGSVHPETSFTAPEYLTRTRRVVGVAARFSSDLSACALAWPADDRPTPGDRLFFDHADLADRVYRVCEASPLDGRLRVLARATGTEYVWAGPPDDPWPQCTTELGYLTLDHEPHCGFAADLYSLGMLTFAVLSGQAEVRAFRESLANVGIALQRRAAELHDVPGRELVRAAEAETGETAEFLAAFLAQVRQRRARYGDELAPLVDELIGAVLRLVIRGEPPLWAVCDRGGDARPGLRRFAADVSAVRGAVEAAEAAARGQAVLQRRLAAAARLRGEPAAPLPPVRLVYPGLDLAAAGGEVERREVARGRHHIDAWRDWAGWEDELTGGPLRALDFLARYGRSHGRTRKSWERFLEWYQNPAEAEDPARGRVRGPADRMAAAWRVVVWLREADALLAAEFFGPWDAALRHRRWWWPGRASGGRVVTRHVRVVPERLREAVEVVNRLQVLSRAEGNARQQHFQRSLAAWTGYVRGSDWLPAVHQLTAVACAQQETLEHASDEWADGWRAHATALTSLADVVENLTAEDRPYLTRRQREQTAATTVAAAAAWLESNWPHPDDAASPALWDQGPTR